MSVKKTHCTMSGWSVGGLEEEEDERRKIWHGVEAGGGGHQSGNSYVNHGSYPHIIDHFHSTSVARGRTDNVKRACPLGAQCATHFRRVLSSYPRIKLCERAELGMTYGSEY